MHGPCFLACTHSAASGMLATHFSRASDLREGERAQARIGRAHLAWELQTFYNLTLEVTFHHGCCYFGPHPRGRNSIRAWMAGAEDLREPSSGPPQCHRIEECQLVWLLCIFSSSLLDHLQIGSHWLFIPCISLQHILSCAFFCLFNSLTLFHSLLVFY